LEFYGGRETSGFQHEVLGEHGSPTYSAFPVDSIRIALTDIPEYQRVILTGTELADCDNEVSIRTRLDMLCGLTPQKGKFWLGGDLGYTSDPCELLVWQEDETGKLSLVYRLHTEHVAYPIHRGTDRSDGRFTSGLPVSVSTKVVTVWQWYRN